MYSIQCGSTGGRFRKVSLYKPGQPGQRGLGFAYRPLHPHNNTVESEQLVVMARAMEFETLRVYTIKEVAWKALLATAHPQGCSFRGNGENMVMTNSSGPNFCSYQYISGR
jgi:hypothetical protein